MAKDWTKLFNMHRGEWVALSEDKEVVLGTGNTVKDALVKAKEVSLETPFLVYVPNELGSYISSPFI